MDWIFGYGSLMWNPGFAYRSRKGAVLRGYHRAYAMYSTRNRGTPDCLGPVLSLAPGGSCTGIAYLLDPDQRAESLRYLDQREGLGRAHRRVFVPLELEGEEGVRVLTGQTYVPILTYTNYIPGVPLARMAELVACGRGKIGTSFDYLRLLIEELARMGTAEPELERLFQAAQRLRMAQEPRHAAALASAAALTIAGK